MGKIFTYNYMVYKYFMVLIIILSEKTKFPEACHALKNSLEVNG